MQLAYWPIKGLVEPIRYLLAYVKQDYEEINFADWDEYIGRRQPFDLSFANLPFIVDGHVKLTESKAIMQYIAAKHDASLLGSTDKDRVQVRVLMGAMADVVKAYSDNIIKKTGQKAGIEASLEKYKTVEKLELLSKYLGDKDYFNGYITVNDFEWACIVYRVWAYSRTFDLTSPIEKFPNLIAHVEKIKGLPGIKEYLTSDKAKLPIHTKGYLPVDIKED